MTDEAEKIRNWLGRARLIYEELKPYEEAVDTLHDAFIAVRIRQERDRLRRKEDKLRKETEKYLDEAMLSPRQFSVLALHYLEYESWNHISERLNIDRRYALLIHTEAIERLAGQKELSA